MVVYTGSAALTQHNMAEHTAQFAVLLLMASSYTSVLQLVLVTEG